jgi:hypothetical protein
MRKRTEPVFPRLSPPIAGHDPSRIIPPAGARTFHAAAAARVPKGFALPRFERNRQRPWLTRSARCARTTRHRFRRSACYPRSPIAARAEVQLQLHLAIKKKERKPAMTGTANDNQEPINIPRRLFALGQIVSTPGALDACPPEYLPQCLARHAGGDWGCVCKEDAASNDRAVRDGGRITEGDRSATTFLLPSEY